MASLVDKKTVGGSWQNDTHWVSATYDFAADGGSIGDLEVLEASSDLIITNIMADVETALTSADLATISLGVGSGGTGIWNAKAVAALSIGALFGMESMKPIKVAAGEKLVLSFADFTILTGKINFKVEVKSFK